MGKNAIYSQNLYRPFATQGPAAACKIKAINSRVADIRPPDKSPRGQKPLTLKIASLWKMSWTPWRERYMLGQQRWAVRQGSCRQTKAHRQCSPHHPSCITHDVQLPRPEHRRRRHRLGRRAVAAAARLHSGGSSPLRRTDPCDSCTQAEVLTAERRSAV